MRRFLQASALLSVLGAAIATPLAAGCGGPGNGAANGNCFFLRAPAALIPVIAAANGLTVVGGLAASEPDVVLVEGPVYNTPEQTLEQVQTDPSVVGFEHVRVASISESNGLSGFVDAYDPDYLLSLTTHGEHDSHLAPYFTTSLWSGYTDQPAAQWIRIHDLHLRSEPERMGGGVIAVIDTGVDPDHPLLQGALVPGYDFLLEQPGIPSEWSALDPATATATENDLRAVAQQSYTGVVEGGGVTAFGTPTGGLIVDQSYTGVVESQDLPNAFGHGTMVAGLVRLTAPAAKIMPLRAFDGDGVASLSDIVRAIYWAVDNGADAINMSFSTDFASEELTRAINYAKKNKVTCVSSAGNAGSEELTYPAAFGTILGVASVDLDGNLSPFSSFGPDLVTLAAPGEGVITAYPGGGYAAAWGTSFSAPFVAGTLLTLLKQQPTGELKRISHGAAEDAVTTGAQVPAGSSTSDAWGAGILDAESTFSVRHGPQ